MAGINEFYSRNLGTEMLKGSGSRLCVTNAKGSYTYPFYVGRHQNRTNCSLRHLSAATVEQAVERFYATVRLPQAVQDDVRSGIKAELGHVNR